MISYSRTELTHEIREKYNALNDSPVIDRTTLVAAVLKAWPKTTIERDLWCRKELVHIEADRFLRAMRIEPPPPKQQDLPDIDVQIYPGHKRLQKRYGFLRSREPVSVLTDEMTRKELEAKQREHEAMAHGHMEHADELRAFIEDKFGI